jgi:Tfp pilus assembly protein PilV
MVQPPVGRSISNVMAAFVPRRPWSRALNRLRQQSGLSLVETLVSAVVMLTGLMGTFLLVDVADNSSNRSRAREGATNIAREVLENARDTSYVEIGQSGWLDPSLQSLTGGAGTVTAIDSHTRQTTVTRRGVTYTVVASWCSVDDQRDGYGTHTSSASWCSDSATTGTADSQSEDFKRVSTELTWQVNNRTQPKLTQTATFGAGGVAVGPTTTALSITQPTGLTGDPVVITANPTGGIVTFLGTAIGASDMKFAVNGVEVSGGVTNNTNGTWSFNWNISTLKDATYSISATAIDALGTRGQGRNISVKLARGTATAPANVTGGYNDVYNGGGSTQQVVELEWDASPEGTVTGYSVEKGGSTVSGCGQSWKTYCIDLSPASSGSTTYTVKTWYLTGAGAAAFASTTYSVTAPSAGGTVATDYWMAESQTVATTKCYNPGGSATERDILSSAPTGSTTTSWAGSGGAFRLFCTPTVPAGAALGAGNVTAELYRTNGKSQSCSTFLYLYHDATPTTYGTLVAGPISYSVPGNTTTATKFTVTFAVPATTLVANDQLVLWVYGSTSSGSCSLLTLQYGSTTRPSKLSLPTLTGGGGGSTLQKPSAPTGLTVTANGDGTRTLTWNAPSSSTPAVDSYRIYRDGRDYTNRIDTAGATGSSITWLDTATGGTSHTYRVTSVASTLTESSMAGPVTG